MRCSGLPWASLQKLPSAWSSGVAQVEIVIMAWVGATPDFPGTAARCSPSERSDRKDVLRVATIS